MDEMQDEQSWMRGGVGSGWQSKEQHQQLHEADPFAEFGDWGTGGAEPASLTSMSSSWQSSMQEHDSTFPSAYPLFSDSVSSLSSPSNLLNSASTFSFTASAPHSTSSSFHSNATATESSLSGNGAKGAGDNQWPSRNTTPALSDLTSPRLSLASTVGSSSASSALSSTPSSVSSSSPVSPLILSQRDAARKPDAIRVPPFDAPHPCSNTRPTFIPPASLPTSLPGAPHVFSSSSPTVPPSNTVDPSKYQYQVRDMTNGTPIFSSSSMSPPAAQPRQLMPRPPPPHSHSHTQPQTPQHTPPPPAATVSPLPPPDYAPSPTIAFRSMSIATASPVPGPDSLSQFHPVQQAYSGKERKQTSIRATRKSVENSPMTAGQRPMAGSQSPAIASASVLAVPTVPTAGQTPPTSKRKSARKLGVMIDVPVKPNANMAVTAALPAGMPSLTPPKMKRSMSKTGMFSPQSFSSSPSSPDRPFPAPVVATISPLTEQRTMRATGVTVASPVEANSRLAPYLANGPTSPPVAAPVGPYSNFFSPPQQHGALTAARAISTFDNDNGGAAAQQRHQQSFHAKQREEHKSNDEAHSRFTASNSSRFTPSDEHSQPSTPYSPNPSVHDAHTRYPGASPSQTPHSSWARQYSAPAAAVPFNQPSSESVRQLGRPERGTFAVPQQPSMARSVSSSNTDRSYQAADSSAAASWAETQYSSRARHSQPSTPLDGSPYPDGSPAPHPSFSPQRPSYLDETASSALLSTLAAKFSAMQRATSAPAQPPTNNYGRQRSDSDNRSVEGQRTPPFNNSNPAALMAQRQQQLLEHFKQTNPTLQALSPEATAFLAALMGAEQTHNSHSTPATAAMHNPPSNNNSRPPSSPSLAAQQPFPTSHQPSSHNSSMPTFSEKQLQQLQQHLSLQQRHLQQKLAQQFQHQGSSGRPANTFSQSGQQPYDARVLPPPSSHQSARPTSTGPLTPCPMSSAGCEMQFRSANEMQAHFLSCHM